MRIFLLSVSLLKKEGPEMCLSCHLPSFHACGATAGLVQDCLTNLQIIHQPEKYMADSEVLTPKITKPNSVPLTDPPKAAAIYRVLEYVELKKVA